MFTRCTLLLVVAGLLWSMEASPAQAADPTATPVPLPVTPRPDPQHPMKPKAVAPLALWRAGKGTINGVKATRNAPVGAETLVAAGDAPIQLDLAKAPETAIYLAPGGTLRIQEQGDRCLVLLDEGAAQLDVRNRGQYASIHVIGASADVKVTGTLFIVERGQESNDFVALIEGKITVSLREEVRRALPDQADSTIELVSRQGIAVGVGGLGQIISLPAQPRLPSSAAARGIQAQVGSGEGSNWDQDGGPVVDDSHGTINDEVENGMHEDVSNAIEKDIATTVIENELQSQALDGPPPLPDGR